MISDRWTRAHKKARATALDPDAHRPLEWLGKRAALRVAPGGVDLERERPACPERPAYLRVRQDASPDLRGSKSRVSACGPRSRA
jgi:hypothetical protein